MDRGKRHRLEEFGPVLGKLTETFTLDSKIPLDQKISDYLIGILTTSSSLLLLRRCHCFVVVTASSSTASTLLPLLVERLTHRFRHPEKSYNLALVNSYLSNILAVGRIPSSQAFIIFNAVWTSP